MTRAIAYIDGFNLYFGLKQANLKRRYWLNLAALADTFVQPNQTVVDVHYFTARIHGSPMNQADVMRQATYLDALAATPRIQIHEGHFLAKSARCKSCGDTWMTFEEKQSDVNLAIQLLMDAMDNRFDTAFLVSGDSDLSTPIRRVRQRFPEKSVIVAFPPNRQSANLRQVANGAFHIGDDRLRKCLLPDPVQTAAGVALSRPATWR